MSSMCASSMRRTVRVHELHPVRDCGVEVVDDMGDLLDDAVVDGHASALWQA
jgi:hypothetical protein